MVSIRLRVYPERVAKRRKTVAANVADQQRLSAATELSPAAEAASGMDGVAKALSGINALAKSSELANATAGINALAKSSELANATAGINALAGSRQIARAAAASGAIANTLKAQRIIADTAAATREMRLAMGETTAAIRAVQESIAGHRRLLEGSGLALQPDVSALFARPNAVLKLADVADTFGALQDTSAFRPLVAPSEVPLPAWTEVLAGLRPRVPEAVESVEVGLAEAANSPGVWSDLGWVARAPLTMQLVLLIACGNLLDGLLTFGTDLAGQELPTEVDTGIKAVMALATALLAVLEARAKVLASDED